jgi:hypothetical protein
MCAFDSISVINNYIDEPVKIEIRKPKYVYSKCKYIYTIVDMCNSDPTYAYPLDIGEVPIKIFCDLIEDEITDYALDIGITCYFLLRYKLSRHINFQDRAIFTLRKIIKYDVDDYYKCKKELKNIELIYPSYDDMIRKILTGYECYSK